MKMLIVALALATLVQGAVAKEPDCRTIDSTNERLACYDAAFPPPKIKQSTAAESDAARAAYKYPFVAEEARTAAKLKNICRGC
ncbi:hypothetical protein JQ554_28910 [Bradyrhizobium diazoefficiens]|nr:type VI secretion system-associated protein TagO [Bradyrhizobium diazoefficiens]UCF52927.1 MAG: hypothetical protein JSV48_27940 [Bradyrhizobium sp.]MBR0968117.1 hypothetical protein [Bradyrhizobium diazoefficiens]MBR0981514.1 hypothetical protein [Bradyrhizobium diazoefficiens]MBR1010967.1 hypothetical protein [Bradyrhizobium diazoefficiens]MBR1017467.1 hypothetical protein [Bradyrhizobium diazoefficiens]